MFNNGNWLLRWYEKKVIKQFWLTVSPLQRKKSSSLPPTHMTLEIQVLALTFFSFLLDFRSIRQ